MTITSQTSARAHQEPRRVEVLGKRVALGSAATAGDFTYAIVEPSPGTSKDRRGTSRRPTHLRDALLTERLGRPICGCRVRDRSRCGARLRLDHDRPLPKTFLLTDPGSREQFVAILMWRVGRDVGVTLRAAEGRR